jgi:hypothetical protein
MKTNQEGKNSMKKPAVLLVMVVCLALAAPALAQPGSGGGIGAGMNLMLYNPETVTTVTGPVEKLEDLPSMGGGGGQGMQYRGVTLKTDQGSLIVHLGPGWFLDEKKFAVKVGDTVEATGSKVTLQNQPALIAREVKAKGATLKLRDDQGFPVWRGKGRGGIGQGPAGGRGMGPGGGQGTGPAGGQGKGPADK